MEVLKLRNNLSNSLFIVSFQQTGLYFASGDITTIKITIKCIGNHRLFIKGQTSGTSSDNKWRRVVQRMVTNDNEWQRVIQRMKTSENEWYNKWQRQRMTTSVTTSDNEWQRMATSHNERQRTTASDNKWCNKVPTNENQWYNE